MFWLIYIAVAAAIVFWDSYIGFGFEFPAIENGPNAVCAAAVWPIGLPIILIIVISNALESAKTKRLARTEQRQRIRLQVEKERNEEQRAIEEEIANLEREERATRRL